tara:strand:+ start:1088 stop:1504 length:417 start_codon:yes stop_codon:yes gene_type:complete
MLKRILLIICVSAAALLESSKPSFAESTYTARCKAAGDALRYTFISTGQLLLEQRLVSFEPTEPPSKAGALFSQNGICKIRDDPPGYRWVFCGKKDGKYYNISLPGNNWTHPHFITPNQVIPNSVQYRGWAGACKVKL